MAGQDPDSEFGEVENPQLTSVLDFYDCDYLLPYVQRILWLSSVKEAVGRIPDDFHLSYDEIEGLVILAEEIHKKTLYDHQRVSSETSRVSSIAEARTATFNRKQ